MTFIRISAICCLLVATIAFPVSMVGQETDEIASIIKDVSIDGYPIAMSGYSYEMEFVRVKRSLIGRSKIKRRYKALLPSRIPPGRLYKHPLLLVYDSTRILTASDIIAERGRIVERLDSVESESEIESDTDADDSKTDGYITLRADSNTVGDQALRIDLLKLLETAEFSKLKRFVRYGRKTISLEFKPSGAKELNEELFYLGLIEGIVFIDEIDKRIVQVEAFPAGGMKKYGSLPEKERNTHRVFYFLQKRMPQGFWFPYRAELNFIEFPYDFKNLAVTVQFTFSDYKHFSTAVESLELDSQEETETTPGN